ncbi:saccharopine dehydrogenase family protein [Corynebacterium sp. H78]|uniref:saccharopine dehydrogenase family protein n=1 Tax=Corynebacterium sp. H78 TaxID=3133417 RepID=UPI0030A7AF22
MTSQSSSSTRNHGRSHDIVVFGATGFVGTLITEYLAEHAPADVRVALAGRRQEKLRSLRDDISSRHPRVKDWPLVVADAASPTEMKALAESTNVVLTLVGPYAQYGRELVKACAEAGTDYVDLTGEVLFAYESVEKYHDVAKQSGARIIHSCGFDSVPSDFAVNFLFTELIRQGHEKVELWDTTLIVKHLRGGMSGGTIDSFRTQVAQTKADPELAKIAANPDALSSFGSGPGGSNQPDNAVVRGKDVHPSIHGWLGPFFMGPHNTRIVRRTASLLADETTSSAAHEYGSGFRYREVMSVGDGPKSWLKAQRLKYGMSAMKFAMATPQLAKFVDAKLPKPGEGPSAEQRAKGRFTYELYSNVRLDGDTQETWKCEVELEQDPGYDGTAMMISNAALALVCDRDRLPKRTGVLTPATGLGEPYLERLQAGGMKFSAKKMR